MWAESESSYSSFNYRWPPYVNIFSVNNLYVLWLVLEYSWLKVYFLVFGGCIVCKQNYSNGLFKILNIYV